MSPPAFNTLRAKESVSLPNHLNEVATAGDLLLDTEGESILANLGLTESPWPARMHLCSRWASHLHDIGKANVYFQKVLGGQADPSTQPVRHELLSGLIAACPELGVHDALKKTLQKDTDSPEKLLNCIIGAVCGHHLKLHTDWSKLAAQALADKGAQVFVEILLDHPDLDNYIPAGAERRRLTLSAVPIGEGLSLRSLQSQFLLAHREWQSTLETSPAWKRFAAALKALLMASDALASAEPCAEMSLREWLRRTLGMTLQEGEARKVGLEKIPGDSLRDFQEEVRDSETRVTVVEAGCGSGKTVAAYTWAENHARGRKLFFCYPTTGTATEGYLDYLHGSESVAKLMHSRSDVDLESVSDGPDKDETESLIRADSLRAWGPKIVACTVDTVAALVRNCRRGLYSSPALLNATFVFDEVHSYGRRLLEAVTRLMEALPGARFLLLSASIQPSRKDFLRNEFTDIRWISGPDDWEELPRYEFQACDRDSCLRQARKACKKGQAVLWVSNTVRRCRKVGKDVKGPDGRVLTYHSRFRYMDRAERHRRVVDSFQSGSAVVGSTTQVAEMSLDIDADLMVTELAPIPSLIQRMGRLNRRVTPQKPGKPRTALILEPASPLPYEEEELERARAWWDEVGDGPYSQGDLRRAWHDVIGDEQFEPEHGSEWLDNGWLSRPGEVREAGFTVRALLEEDADACRQSSHEVVRREIPVIWSGEPRLGDCEFIRGRPVIPEGTYVYSQEGGFEWK